VRALLGEALEKQGRLDQAIAEYRLAEALDERQADYPLHLARVLRKKGDRAGVAQALRRVVVLRPGNVPDLINLGAALFDIGDLGGAEEALKKAIAIDSKVALAHYNFGRVREERRDWAGATAAYRKALDLDPREARALVHLGRIAHQQRNHTEAIRLTRQALAIDPKLAAGQANLGGYLIAVGRFEEAVTSLRRGLEQVPRDHPLRGEVVKHLQQAQRWLALDRKLPLVLAGRAAPADDQERLALAELCRRHRAQYAAAARLYAAAFASSPGLVADPRHNTRFLASCCAVQSALGRGADAAGLRGWERSDLRGQALDWLTADLDLLVPLATRDPGTVRVVLHVWRGCGDLVAVREPAALEKLPEAEAQAWRELWARAADLLGGMGG
jgi:tetratricopeptide (TPR) repeat protein